MAWFPGAFLRLVFLALSCPNRFPQPLVFGDPGVRLADVFLTRSGQAIALHQPHRAAPRRVLLAVCCNAGGDR
ncbi:hypothetical protein [Thermoleptolyngbya sp.]